MSGQTENPVIKEKLDMNRCKIIGILFIGILFLQFHFSFAQLKKDSLSAQSYYQEGEKLWKLRKLEEAKEQFKKAIAADINFTPAHRSYIDLTLGMADESRTELQKEYEALLKAHPNNPVIHYSLGKIYEDDAEKEKAFQKAIDLDPKYPWGYFGMAYIHIQKKEIDKAISCYEKAVELDPNEVLFYVQLASQVRQKDPVRYNQVQELIIEKFPGSWNAGLIQFERASQIADEKERIAAFESYWKSNPDGPNIPIALKQIFSYYEKNNPEKGEKLAREVLAHPMPKDDKRSHSAAYNFLFTKAMNSSEPSQVKKIADEIFNSNNPDPSLYFGIANQFKEKKHYDDTEKFYFKALEKVTPENVYGTMAHGSFPDELLKEYCQEVFNSYSSELGQFYLEANRPQDALTQFNLVKMKEPEPGHYFNLAKAYHQVGEKEKAYEYLIETLSLAAQSEARDLLKQLAKELNKKDDPMQKIWQKRLQGAIPAPNFTLPDLDGNQVSLSSFRGKVVLLNFWFPACGPCQMEFPHLQKLHEKYQDQGLKILLVQVAQSKEDGKKFLSSKNYTMQSLYADSKWAQNNYGVIAAPSNFFIDRTGRIIFKSTGYTPGKEKEIEAQVLELLEFKGEVNQDMIY